MCVVHPQRHVDDAANRTFHPVLTVLPTFIDILQAKIEQLLLLSWILLWSCSLVVTDALWLHLNGISLFLAFSVIINFKCQYSRSHRTAVMCTLSYNDRKIKMLSAAQQLGNVCWSTYVVYVPRST